MNPSHPKTPSPVARGTAALLLAAAGSLLAQAPAAAQMYSENANATGGDFGNTFATRTTLAIGTATRFTQVTGDNEDLGSDPDFFTFTGLAGGTPYTLSITAGDPSDGYTATFQGYNDAGTAIGSQANYTYSDAANTVKSISGTIPASGRLTIGINPQTSSVEGGASAYSTTLTAAAAPEPATTALVALGAAVAALAARRARRQTPAGDAAAE